MILNPQLPNKPAFNSLRPEVQSWEVSNDRITSKIKKVMGHGVLYKIKGASAEQERFYLHKSDANKNIFLKITELLDLDRHLDADLIANYLLSHNISTSVLLDGYPKKLTENTLLLGYDFLPYRFAEITESDIRQVGTILANMHKVLATFPGNKSIDKRTQERIEMLKVRSKKIMFCKSHDFKYQKLKDMLLAESMLWELLRTSNNEQLIHGDLNYGNIIFSEEDSKPILLDFEDSMISRLSPVFDIAQVIERFILSAEIEQDFMVLLGRVLLDSYSITNINKNYIDTYSISDYMRVLSVRSLLTLAELESKGRNIDSTEWDKFFYLYELVKKNTYVLDEIQRIA